MSESRISYLPTEGLSYDPQEEVYWNPEALDGEIIRVFEVCHGCRMCFKYCDSFVRLFSFVDSEDHDGDVRKVTLDERDAVMAACFQCKLCEVECPYTPADGHEFQLDFPKLVHRYRAQKTRISGTSFQNRILGNPDLAGRAARMSFGLANVMNRVGLHRWFLQQVLGIHKDKLLPEFASSTFTSRARRAGRNFEPGGEAVLFPTCYVENNEPDIGQDALAVYDQNQVDLRCAKGLQCCGMPAWESGDIDTLRKRARANLDALEPHLEAGSDVVVLNPTCSLMLRKEYPELLEGADRERAERLAGAVKEASEFLWGIRKEERFAGEAASSPGQSVAYHSPCHLRAQRVGFKGRDLIKKVTGAAPTTVMQCCGHDGTWAMKVEGFEDSQHWGRKAFAEMADADSEVWVTDCPLAAIQFQQHAGVKPMHPMTVLARSYEEGGFPSTDTQDEE